MQQLRCAGRDAQSVDYGFYGAIGCARFKIGICRNLLDQFRQVDICVVGFSTPLSKRVSDSN